MSPSAIERKKARHREVARNSYYKRRREKGIGLYFHGAAASPTLEYPVRLSGWRDMDLWHI